MLQAGVVSALVKTFDPAPAIMSATPSEEKSVPSGPPAAVPPSLRPHFKVPSKPLVDVAESPPSAVRAIHKKMSSPLPQLSAMSVAATSAASEELPRHHHKSSRHSRTSSDSALEIGQESGTASSQPHQAHLYKNHLFQSQGCGHKRASDTNRASKHMPPLSEAMRVAVDGDHTYPPVQTSTTPVSTVPQPPGTTAAAFYRSPTSSTPVIHSVCAASDSFLTHSESGVLCGSLPSQEGDAHGAHVLAAHHDPEGRGEVDNPMEATNTEDRDVEGGSSSSVLQSSSNLYITSISAGVHGASAGDTEQQFSLSQCFRLEQC